MIHTMQFAYLTNFSVQAFRYLKEPIPYTSALLSHWLGASNTGDLASINYGYTPGMFQPADSSPIWIALFGKPYVAMLPGDLDVSQVARIRKLVAASEQGYGERPFINKTNSLSLRIRLLNEIFGFALFIWIRRADIDTLQSIYLARTSNRKYSDWIGAQPVECEEYMSLPLTEQIVRQIKFIERSIRNERNEIGARKVLEVSYESLCSQPEFELKRISSWLSDFGVPSKVDRNAIPQLEASTGIKVQKEIYNELVRLLDGWSVD